MKFTDFPPCKHRFACLQCRNDRAFLDAMGKRFGEWECPEGIALDTPIEKMPQHIQVKLKSYQERLSGQNREVVERNNRQVQPMINQNINQQSFLDMPMCKQRNVCNECRNNIEFRKRMEQQFGEWKCPEGIPINTPISEMPDKIRSAHEMRQHQVEEHKNKLTELKQDILDLEGIVPPQGQEKLDRLKYFIFPDMKEAKDCIHKGVNKKIEQKCCGGKVKMVDGFVCAIKGDASQRTCRTCNSFSKR